MTYQQYRKKSQAEFDALPIFFCFNNEQFKEEMEKRGLTENDTDKIYRLGNNSGGFYLKSDAQIIRDFMEKEDELPKLMQDDEFAQSAFYYEMGNHEYHINWEGDYDVCSCFGRAKYSDEKTYREYLLEMGYDEHMVNNFKIAQKKFYKDADENGWY